MALPPASIARTLKHRRCVDIEVFDRGGGLWEVDARLTDLRCRDALLATGVRPAGQPIHDLRLRLVIDERFNIVDAGAETREMPYPGQCDAHGDVHRRLVGLNLMQGFRAAVRQRLGGVLACARITEMTQALPTAVVQAFAGTVIDTRGDAESAQSRSRSTAATPCAPTARRYAFTTHAGTVNPLSAQAPTLRPCWTLFPTPPPFRKRARHEDP